MVSTKISHEQLHGSKNRNTGNQSGRSALGQRTSSTLNKGQISLSGRIENNRLFLSAVEESQSVFY